MSGLTNASNTDLNSQVSNWSWSTSQDWTIDLVKAHYSWNIIECTVNVALDKWSNKFDYWKRRLCVSYLFFNRGAIHWSWCQPQTIEVKMEEGTNWRVTRRHWCHLIRLESVFRNPQSSSPKDEPFNQQKYLKIFLPSVGLKMSNFTPACEPQLFISL